MKRILAAQLSDALDYAPAVALLGPRQPGKTTLALEIARERPAVYPDLESEQDRAKLAQPEFYLSDHLDTRVIVDEVHRAPGLFPVLRGLIDRARREGRRTGLYLLLGRGAVSIEPKWPGSNCSLPKISMLSHFFPEPGRDRRGEVRPPAAGPNVMQLSLTMFVFRHNAEGAMTTLTVTARGQVTFRKDVLQHLGIKPGDKLELDLLPDGRGIVRAARPTGSIDGFVGLLAGKTGKVATIDEIDEAIAQSWAGKE